MPLPQPILDDRSYEQLRDELVQRIPVYAPEWTDFNASDPGITLIELFAFLGENLLFRFNQIPESTQLQFLRLLDVPLHPAAVATGFVSFTTTQPSGVLVPQRTTVQAGNIPFETTLETVAWPLSAHAVGRLQRGAPQPGEEQEFATRAWDAHVQNESDSHGEQPVYYAAQVLGDDPTTPGAEALDLSTAVDGMLWVAVLAEKGSDLSKLGDAIVNIGIATDDTAPVPADTQPCPGGAGSSAAPSVVWQLSTGIVDGTVPRYTTVGPVGDTTNALTRPGVVRLQLPQDVTKVGVFTLPDADLAGTGDFPPVIDADLEAKLAFWLRAFRADGGKLGSLVWVGANAAEVEQVQEANPEFLGTGTGDAGQKVSLVHAQVIPGTLALDVEEPTGWARWQQVDDFDASGEDDRHYVLDPEAGRIEFGDGVRGAVPQIGRRIRAAGYRYGGGTAGNVPAKALKKIALADVTASNPLPTRGGAEAETIAAGLDRVPGELRRHDRAVTASDFRELALETPGVTLGRAECLPLFYPKAPDIEAAGVVSVVVWPADDPKHPSAPVPDRTTLSAVCAWLDARRLVTTELYVVEPTYHKVAVAVGIQTKPGYGIDAVRRWVELVVRQYLAPLPPFGPSGGGWPLGRRVLGPELVAAALQVEGVDYVQDLAVAGSADGGVTWTETSPIELAPYEVVELAEITVVEGPPLSPGQALAPAQPPGVPVPIPVPRQEC